MISKGRTLLAFLFVVGGSWGIATSCSLMNAIVPSAAPPPRPFNHEAHLVRGLECADCHDKAEEEVQAGMPTREMCWLCHEELDEDPDKPREQKVAWFEDKSGEARWSAFEKQSEEVIFSHQVHADKKVTCLECHSGMDKNTGLVPGGIQRMSACQACHEEKAPAKNATLT